MNREGAETYLRLLAEAVLRHALAAGREQGLTGMGDAGASGELFLMSFTRTGAGARFFAVWNIRAPALRDIGLIPFGQFTVTDDRGARYGLEFASSGDSGWTSEVGLCPAPPPDARWL